MIHDQVRPKTWRSSLSWPHSMIHGTSGAGTRTKMTAAASPFQRILIRLVSMLDEGDIAKIVQGYWLNLKRTWQLSWGQLVAWGRTWRMRIQRSDVLISAVLLRLIHIFMIIIQFPLLRTKWKQGPVKHWQLGLVLYWQTHMAWNEILWRLIVPSCIIFSEHAWGKEV
jgi:hypothetical protein